MRRQYAHAHAKPFTKLLSYDTIFDLDTGLYLRSEVASAVWQELYTSDTPPHYSFELATTSLSADPQALIYEYLSATRMVNLYFNGGTISIPSSVMSAQTDDGMGGRGIVRAWSSGRPFD